ncbi:MAG: hypothetical protein AAF827_22320 [Cyanobacteria bacterium P01_D01_bin.6]
MDYWCIRQWGWESTGTGGATALSQGVMLAVGLSFWLREVAIAEF